MLGVPVIPYAGAIATNCRSRGREPWHFKHVNAVIVGAGAGGGIAAKQLAAGGLSVVLLERGQWLTAADCRKDDLRNQRTRP